MLNSLQGKAQDDGAANGGGAAEIKATTCTNFNMSCILEKSFVLIGVVERKAFSSHSLTESETAFHFVRA